MRATDSAAANVDALAALPSLGLTSAQMLVDAGVPDVATLEALGPIECYRLLRFRFGRRVTINYVYAMECAIRRIDWRLLEDARKAELKALAKQVTAALEQSLDAPPRPRT